MCVSREVRCVLLYTPPTLQSQQIFAFSRVEVKRLAIRCMNIVNLPLQKIRAPKEPVVVDLVKGDIFKIYRYRRGSGNQSHNCQEDNPQKTDSSLPVPINKYAISSLPRKISRKPNSSSDRSTESI